MKLTCKWCGVSTPYTRSDKYAGTTQDLYPHKCNYIFMRQLTEFGEGVRG